MRNNLVTMTIADYCQALDRSEVTINKNYQRNPQVWPPQPRSYLIETILRRYPIPKLALHQITDLRSRKTIKHVVDGQQRTIAIRQFYANELRLSTSLELKDAAGRTYSELPEEHQQTFLAYVLQFDQFEAASEEDVRDYFRRINSFTAPLNAEEQRHARYQGPMKWLINSLSSRYGKVLVELGVLTEKQAIRMADSKLLSEIMHALLNGVTTTTKIKLDALYAANNKGAAVEEEDALRSAIEAAFDLVLRLTDIRGTALMRMNVFYALLLAAVEVSTEWDSLAYLRPADWVPNVSPSASANLLKLAAALEDPESYPDLRDFTDAAAEKTNVKDQREMRVRWLIRALSESEI